MSGGVGPTCSDISLPNEREQEQKLQEDRPRLKTLNALLPLQRKLVLWHGIKAAAPAAQVFMEGVAFSDRNEITKVEQDYEGSTRRLPIGRALAVANLAFRCLFTSVEPSRSTPLD
ncbi:hypothetical protein POTOM_042567 [Populus tomentosa]|uniref:Uncharacterized protein n=1 Tax=Populus tomentosa TaxID=118781 RepID=A0A8X7YP19_POPTO|nr:hypothetical protein POTOM_042567 [Populus tomentosa]